MKGSGPVPLGVRGLYVLSCAALFAMPMGTSAFTIVGFCLLALWVFSGEFIRGAGNYLRESWVAPVLCIVVISWLGLLWTPDRDLGVKYASKGYYWLYALAVAGAAPIARNREHLVWAFLLGLCLNSMAAFLQLAQIVPRFSVWGAKGYSGFYGGYNTLGVLLVLGILTASFYLKSAVRKKRTLAACLFAAYFCHLMILESRGAYFCFLVLSPLVFRNVVGERRRWWTLLACLLAAGVLYSSPIVRDRVGRAGADVQHYLKGSTGPGDLGRHYSDRLDRVYMWRWAITLFAEHPFLGVGTGGYGKAVILGGGEKEVDHPHNNFLYMAASFGVIGLVLLGWLFWILLMTGWRNRKDPIGFFVLSAALVLLVGGATETHVLDSGGAFLFAVTAGLLSAVRKGEVPEKGAVQSAIPGECAA